MTLRDRRAEVRLRRRKPLNPFETASRALHAKESRGSTRRLRKRQGKRTQRLAPVLLERKPMRIRFVPNLKGNHQTVDGQKTKAGGFQG